ncbi:DNA polymerase [Corynebacterium confusum]|uniref:DNA polymerase n=1 Tax=Corynebacterium confusum TaxID=71254 RepID=UPI0025B408C1|nr:DNA polymerase [Corynebacterium confusum]WJY89010.1 DNA polymerase I, thermostable [Corynebacterium confusum]
MEAKKKTPVATGGQNNDNGQAVSVSACNDTTVVSDRQLEDTKSSPVHTVTPKLTDEHLEELRSSAISDEVIASCGVYSARTIEAVPKELQWIGPDALPALVFPMEEISGETTYQVKPRPGSVCDSKGRPKKYICPTKDNEWGTPPPALTVLRPVTDETKFVLIVEGTKQALAALSNTDDTVAVYRITGIWGWKGLQNYAVLSQFMGLYVCIVPDADASTNRRVYDGAREFRDLLMQYGASPVRFVQVPGQGKQGLDDVLAGLAEDKRAEMLDLWISKAQDKPARKMPKMPEMRGGVTSAEELKEMLDEIGANGSLLINYDEGHPQTRRETMFKALHATHAGKALFRQGTTAVEMLPREEPSEIFEVTDGKSQPEDARREIVKVNRANGLSLVSEAVTPYRLTKNDVQLVDPTATDIDTMFQPKWAKRFPQLNGLVNSPIITRSGRIITVSGLDPETGLFVDLDADVENLAIPENPTEQDIAAAREKLEDIFSDFPFKTPQDFSRLIALLLSMLFRPSVDKSPAACISGSGPAVGKGVIMSGASTLITGSPVPVTKCPSKDDEFSKVLTSMFLAGNTLALFDEPDGVLDFKSLAAAITAERHEGRVLGESRMISVPNNMQMVFTGNNVSCSDDNGRRFFYIDLEVPTDFAEARSGFKYPRLNATIKEKRPELLAALLTFVQAWIVAGRPEPRPGAPVGSFEEWYFNVGGVLEHVGYGDFMDGVAEQRRERNDGERTNIMHLYWLYAHVQGSGRCPNGFRPYDIERIIAKINEQDDVDSSDTLWAKLGMEDPYVPLPSGIYGTEDARSFSLNRVYRRLENRTLDGLAIESIEGGPFSERRYQVVWRGAPEDDPLAGGGPFGDGDDGDDGDPGTGGDGGNGGGTPPPAPEPTPTPAETADEPVSPAAPSDSTTVVFDLETGDADDLHVTDDPDFVRLATYSVNGAEPVATTDIASELIPLLEHADTIVGHNIVQYDLPALQRLYGLDDKALIEAGKVHDTLILSRLAAGGDTNLGYGLDAVAERCGVDGKLLRDGDSALKALAKQYGGFDKIPLDNAEYIAYALQDVRANVAVYNQMLPAALEAVSAEYLRREHEKMHVLSVVEAHGIRVDTAKVEQFLAEEAVVKAEIREWLVDTVGIPDEGKEPWSSNSGKQAIADYLDSFGVAVPRTKSGRISISAKALNQLAAEHADVSEVVELAEKMEALLQSSTPASTIKKHLRGDKVYPSIQSSQVTGRLSTTNPGMTVFGSRDARLIRQREMIVADNADEELISVDLSQIDARCMAAGSGDSAYAELFAPGRDAHTEMAIRVFGDAERRPDAKALGHAANYGMGSKSFAAHAGISEVEAQGQLDRMHFEFPQLEYFKNHLRKHAEALGWVATGFGRRVAVGRSTAYTQAPAAYGQGTARDVFLEGVLNLPQEVLEMIRIFVHDEIVLSVPRDRAEEIKQTVMAAFNAVTLPGKDGVEVPVLSDSAGPAESWAGCK